MNVIEKLKELGYTTVSASHYGKVAEWKSWYQGDVKNFSWYKVRTGPGTTRKKRYSLGMAKKLCEDWAGLLMNEKVKITLEGKREQEFVDSVLEQNNFRVMAGEMQELKSALGTAAYIPRVVGMEVDGEGRPVGSSARGIALDYVTVERIFPLAWENGVIRECAFSSVFRRVDADYCYLQIHRRVNGLYEIENRVFALRNGQLGEELPPASVPGLERVPPLVRTGSEQRQFVIDRLRITNNFDPDCPLGISVFANAIDVLKGVDKAYDSYVGEFEFGKKRIMVKPSAARYLDGEPIFDPDDTIYHVLPEDTQDGSVITPIDMSLRTQEHNRGIQDQLNLLSAKCGFGESYYRFDGGSVATATQVISENSAMFRSIKKHEIILEQVLTELCRIILRLGNSAMGAGLDENVKLSIDFDDSIIEDKESEFNRDFRMVSAGILNPYEFRMKWLNEDEKTARAALPGMETLADERQNEIE